MKQKTTLSQSIEVTEQKAQYDAACKKVLAEKTILAWIMKYTMKEYADYEVGELVGRYIVGEPEVSNTKVMPDETNISKVSGTGVEDTTVTEGSVTYDIQFRAILRSMVLFLPILIMRKFKKCILCGFVQICPRYATIRLQDIP